MPDGKLRIGLIQTGGIGDIIIALPIAQCLIDAGHEVVWPIDSKYLTSFQQACPRIEFRPVLRPVAADQPLPGASGMRYLVDEPREVLQAEGCETMHLLYSFLGAPGYRVANPGLAPYLKFDEYKYAVAGVPFSMKWRLSIVRNSERERALFDRVAPDRPYACLHSEGSNYALDPTAVLRLTGGLPTVRISPLTHNIFDWLLVIERAARLIMVDSCYANLVEQLGIEATKYLFLRTPGLYTPVYRNGWSFAAAPPRAAMPPTPPIKFTYSL